MSPIRCDVDDGRRKIDFAPVQLQFGDFLCGCGYLRQRIELTTDYDYPCTDRRDQCSCTHHTDDAEDRRQGLADAFCGQPSDDHCSAIGGHRDQTVQTRMVQIDRAGGLL
ncbi:Uncharacterised protein [Mycobacteroides abscessus subsp. abscessus]|nr:Uncharacterised protein [Mycobacteroides abscessus subsp. abscessus]